MRGAGRPGERGSRETPGGILAQKTPARTQFSIVARFFFSLALLREKLHFAPSPSVRGLA